MMGWLCGWPVRDCPASTLVNPQPKRNMPAVTFLALDSTTVGDTSRTCNLWAKNRLHPNQGVCLYPVVLSRSTSANFPKVEQVFQLQLA
jgi:hypothetical protein